MVSRHAVHTKIQWQQQFSKSIVRFRRVILDQVAGDNDAIGLPFAGLIMIKDALQRSLCGDATQVSFGIGEKMRIRDVQNPYRIAVGCIRLGLNMQSP